MAKKTLSELDRCGYCGKYAAKEYPGYRQDPNYLWAYRRVLTFGVCQECHDYFDEKYRDIEILECEICGQKIRVSGNRNRARKAIKAWQDNGCKTRFPIQAQVYYQTCHGFDCLVEYKRKAELPLKLEEMKREHKAFKAALSELRKTIKGD